MGGAVDGNSGDGGEHGGGSSRGGAEYYAFGIEMLATQLFKSDFQDTGFKEHARTRTTEEKYPTRRVIFLQYLL